MPPEDKNKQGVLAKADTTNNTSPTSNQTSTLINNNLDPHITKDTAPVYKFNQDNEYGVFENPSDAVSTLPNSLFYEVHSYEDGRTGLFNYYLLGNSKKATDGTKFRYDKSELNAHNQVVSSEASRNPTAKAIMYETTYNGAYLDPTSIYMGQPYNVKDFIFCKWYGTIPNNRMITLRRFPNPTMDNLSMPIPGDIPTAGDDGAGNTTFKFVKSEGIDKNTIGRFGVGLPVAQAVTYFGDETGNSLTDILGIKTGLKFDSKGQIGSPNGIVNEFGNDPGIMASPIGKVFEATMGEKFAGPNGVLSKISNVLGTLTDPDNVETRIRRTMFDALTAGDGPLSKRIFVDVNTVDKMLIRGKGFEGGEQQFNLKFVYTLTSAGTINSRMLFIDLLGNLLAIGSDYGKFLTPQILYESKKQGLGFPGGPNAYVKFLTRPVDFINDLLTQDFSAEMSAKKKTLTDQVGKAKEELSGISKGIPLPRDGVIYKSLTALLTTGFVQKLQFEPMMLSGYPTGEWHVVVGNPLNPIAMMGNLICSQVEIKLNDILGPDDFPTEMTATYTMKAARQKHRGDFESMLNRGNGRLYLGKMPITGQSDNAYIGMNSGTNAKQYQDMAAMDPRIAQQQAAINNNTLTTRQNNTK